MRIEYLIDENLPPALAELFRAQGLEARHINEFGAGKPVKDHGIRRYVLNKVNVVVVTRDDDFVKSYFSRKVPDKVIFVFGISAKTEVIDAFTAHLHELSQIMPKCELVELNQNGIIVHRYVE